ncbi:MAG: 5-oxoprolinase subunit PxpA [Thermoleophilaceae bacterium]
MRTLDINCDMGESFGNWRLGHDDELWPLITTGNLACGFHASDPQTMIGSVEHAGEHGVAVGAHPGLPDLLGFGRRVMSISRDDAYAYALYQGGALRAIVEARGGALHHVKSHGALYLMLSEREDLADAWIEAAGALMPDPLLYWPAGEEDTALAVAARERGVRVVTEFYPDLDYSRDGRLLIERKKLAVDPGVAVGRVRRLLTEGTIEAEDGTAIPLEVESICLHGDTPTAPSIAAGMRSVCYELGVEVRPAP